MKAHEFTIVASGLDPEADDFEDRIYEAGCDDATLSFQKGAIVLEFAREAASFAKALVSAIADVQRAGAKVERIEPDSLVSLRHHPPGLGPPVGGVQHREHRGPLRALARGNLTLLQG